MENSSIQPHEVLSCYRTKKDQVWELWGTSKDAFDVFCDGVVEALFHRKPSTSTVREQLAPFLLDLVDRDVKRGKDFVAVRMAAYTNDGAPHYTEDNEQYLVHLSNDMYRHADYRTALQRIAEAVRDGRLPPTHIPEKKPPTPES